MFVLSHRNIRLPSPDGKSSFFIARGYVGEIPDWAADTPYFRALVADGKISVPASTRDKDTQAAAEDGPDPYKRGKGKKAVKGTDANESAEPKQ